MVFWCSVTINTPKEYRADQIHQFTVNTCSDMASSPRTPTALLEIAEHTRCLVHVHCVTLGNSSISTLINPYPLPQFSWDNIHGPNLLTDSHRPRYVLWLPRALTEQFWCGPLSTPWDLFDTRYPWRARRHPCKVPIKMPLILKTVPKGKNCDRKSSITPAPTGHIRRN